MILRNSAYDQSSAYAFMLIFCWKAALQNVGVETCLNIYLMDLSEYNILSADDMNRPVPGEVAKRQVSTPGDCIE